MIEDIVLEEDPKVSLNKLSIFLVELLKFLTPKSILRSLAIFA